MRVLTKVIVSGSLSTALAASLLLLLAVPREGPGPSTARFPSRAPTVSEGQAGPETRGESAVALPPRELEQEVTPARENGLAIGGVVLNSDGEAVSGARVRVERSLQSREARSGPGGTFVLAGLLPGAYTVIAEAPGYARAVLLDAPAGGPPLEVILEAELTFRGEVVDERGRPVSGVDVWFVRLSRDAGDVAALFRSGSVLPRDRRADASVTFRSATDLRGLFAIQGLGGGTYRVELSREGFQGAVIPYLTLASGAPLEARDLEFTLLRGRAIRGRVVDPEGKGIAGAGVRLEREDAGEDIEESVREERPRSLAEVIESVHAGTDAYERQTEETGRFAFTTLPAGAYRIEAHSESSLPFQAEGIAADGEALTIVLEPGASLSGRIVVKGTGEPVEGATVHVLPQDSSAPHRVLSDENGSFHASGLERIPCDVRVLARGYLPAAAGPSTPGDEEAVVVELAPAGAVSGRVVEASGNPADGLDVILAWEEAAGPAAKRRRRFRAPGPAVHTGSDGSYRIPLDRAGCARVLVRGGRYLETRSDLLGVEDPAEGISGIDIVVEQSGRVTGTVLGERGRPVRGAFVEVRGVPEESEELPSGAELGSEEGGPGQRRAQSRRLLAFLMGRRSGRADARGYFEFSGLESGRYELTARASGHVDFRSGPFSLRQGEERELGVQLEPELTISGRVLSSDGELIPSAEVAIVEDSRGGESRRTLAGILGAYRIGKLRSGSYTLRAITPGFASTCRASVEAGSEEVDVILEPLVSFSGVVVAANGSPVERFGLGLQAENEARLARRERAWIREQRSFENNDGSFRIDDLPPGRYTVAIDVPDRQRVVDLRVDLRAGAAAEFVLSVPEGDVIQRSSRLGPAADPESRRDARIDQ